MQALSKEEEAIVRMPPVHVYRDGSHKAAAVRDDTHELYYNDELTHYNDELTVPSTGPAPTHTVRHSACRQTLLCLRWSHWLQPPRPPTLQGLPSLARMHSVSNPKCLVGQHAIAPRPSTPRVRPGLE